MKKTLILFALVFSTCLTMAQSGVNIKEVNSNAAFQIEAPDKDKGVIIPRLTEAQRDAIPTTDAEDGLSIYNIDEGCINYWSKLDKEWKSICGKIGKAVFEIKDCASVEVKGQYLSGTAVSGSNYLKVEVEVTKIGTYTISAIADPDNGYYFTLSGEFLSTGDYTLNIPTMGTPKDAQEDEFTILLNGALPEDTATACTFKVTVEDSTVKPLFKMDCSSVKVNGVYKQDQALGVSNTISVTLNVETAALGSTYNIKTDFVEGISFEGTGVLTSTTQVVTLHGTGVPAGTNMKKMTLITNSALTAAVCMANVVIVIPKKRLLAIGTDKNGFGYNFSGTAASNKLITTKANYGDLETSIIAFEGWEEIIDGTNSPNTTYMTNHLLGANPVDILVLGYSYTITDAVADVIRDYMVRGGVVIAYTESPAGVSRLMQNLTGNSQITGHNVNSAGTLYRLSYVDDAILNGPFGDIRGKYWGEDASSTVRVQGLDTGSLEVYSDAKDYRYNNTVQAGLTAFRHKNYNFIYVGDGGFNSNNNGNDLGICPFKLDANGFPIPKASYGVSGTPVYNAVFTANAFAWALERAENNGINTNK